MLYYVKMLGHGVTLKKTDTGIPLLTSFCGKTSPNKKCAKGEENKKNVTA